MCTPCNKQSISHPLHGKDVDAQINSIKWGLFLCVEDASKLILSENLVIF